ncbi:MAG: glycosyltransferase family 2 protein [Capsulimonadaceae bacterium]|nr:glycosyltransferase family 2 protein [Capsulimonadaceae bacterium]
MRVSVIIVTINRPDCVRICLEHLQRLAPAPDQLIVVDSSRDEATRAVAAVFPDVLYLRNELGDGHTTASRNIGSLHATGDIVAFLDDDAYVRPGWLEALLQGYDDPTVGAVGGRALRNQHGEDVEGVDEIGKFTNRGVLTGNFAADPGKIVEVDHLIGCNMSFRREVIARTGGFREGFPGYCLREESDIFFVMRRMGYRALFNPACVVDHVAGPKPKGKRFDVRYEYYAEHNHYILLIRNFGLLHPIVWRYWFTKNIQAYVECVRRIAGAVVRLGAFIAGTISGLAMGTVWSVRQGRDPVRRDPLGEEMMRVLGARTQDKPVELTRTDLPSTVFAGRVGKEGR